MGLLASLAVLSAAGLLLFAEESSTQATSAQPDLEKQAREVGEATTPQASVATGSQIFVDPSKAGQELPARPLIDTHEGLQEELLPSGLYIVRGNFRQTLRLKTSPGGETRFFHTTGSPRTPSVEESEKKRVIDSDEETSNSGSKERSG
jgi:hypothetical protein